MKKDLTFAEFDRMCKDAGISADAREMEQDFRNGVVMADLVDVLMDQLDAQPEKPTLDTLITTLGGLVDDIGTSSVSGIAADTRKYALSLAATAIRLAADYCHDEADGN